MPYILKPRKIDSGSHENWVWVQKATATKPVAYALEIWGGYDPEHYMTATQVKQWKGLSWPDRRKKSLKKTVAAYKKKGYVVFEPKDCVKLFKEYVPRSYAAAVKSKKLGNRQSAESWAEYDAPMNYIWDKPSAVSVYNKFLKSMTWGGKKPKNAPKSPASYFWGWGRPLDFSDGFIGVIPSCYGSESVVLHNYKTGKVAVVTQAGGDDDEAGEYAMSVVAFEWKLNPKLVAAMNKPIMSGKGQQYVMKGTGRGVKKPAVKKTTTKAKAKTGRKAPTISATRRKIGTRMRGNDGKMWEVKKSGKSQRWMAGAESFNAQTGFIVENAWINYGKGKMWDEDRDKVRKMFLKDIKKDYPHIPNNKITITVSMFDGGDWRGEAHIDAPFDPKNHKYQSETFEADFNWEYHDYGDDPRTVAANKSYGKNAGKVTIGPAVKKAKKDGWKQVNYHAKYGPRIWGMMAKSPQWKPWVKDLTARCKSEGHIMSETTDIFNGKSNWRKPGQYNPSHMGEDGSWEILTKDNKIMLLYYYANDELTTRLMRKTFTVPKTKAANKPKARRKPKAKPKTGRRVSGRSTVRVPVTNKSRPSPSQSAAATKVGTRKRGNDGFMWQVKRNKNGVHRWARDSAKR